MTFTVWHIVGACVIVAIIAAVVATVRTRRKAIRKVAYMMDALQKWSGYRLILQWLQQGLVEQERNDADETDSVFVRPKLLIPVQDDNLAEEIPGVLE